MCIAEEGDEEGEHTSSASEGGGLGFDMEDAEDEDRGMAAGDATGQPGWAALHTAIAEPIGRRRSASAQAAADAAKLDAAKIKSLSAFLGDSLSLGRALSTPIADPPQLTVRRDHTLKVCSAFP